MSGNREKAGKASIKFVIGCPRSQLDAVRLNNYLEQNNWSMVNDVKNADLILTGLCGFDDRSERISKNVLKQILRRKKKASLVVSFGCLCDINPHIFKGQLDVVPIKYHQLEQIEEIVKGRIKFDDIDEPNVVYKNFKYSYHNFHLLDRIKFEIGLFFDGPIKYAANVGIRAGARGLRPIGNPDYFIKVAKGCTGHCSYCAIKGASGPLISYPIEKILKQFENGLLNGYRVFRLLGEDVGGYGYDKNYNIISLLEKIFSRNGDFQIVIEDFSPKWIIRYLNILLKLLKDSEHHIHHIVIPIQSGSEKIVKRMGRGYSVNKAVKALSALRRTACNLKIATHIIVGFPGETEQDFKDTNDVLAALNFDHIEAHFYSDRPQCASVQFDDKVSDTIKIWRLWRLRQKFNETCRIRI